jgi:multidrug resistance efflux pump
VIQHTIQLIPRLPEPTLVTAVLVEPDVTVEKGQPLFQFDRRPYEYKVQQLEADLSAARERVASYASRINHRQAEVVAAKQDVLILKEDEQAADAKVQKIKSELAYAQLQRHRYEELASQGAGSTEELEKWSAQLKAEEANLKEADSAAARARLKYESQINGVNTIVISAEAELAVERAELREAEADITRVKAQLELAKYYLDNTTMVAPEKGHIINLQVRPGMVAGDFRVGAIAAFIVESDRYVLGNFFQEQLKYVKTGQPVEVALNRYPGQIFKGTVDAIWWANGDGQLLPSGTLPVFSPPPAPPQSGFAVKIVLADKDQQRFPIGAQGAAAIYTGKSPFDPLRRIALRTHSWMNWLYPLNL